MASRRFVFALSIATFLSASCSHSQSREVSSPSSFEASTATAAAQVATVLRIHWMGKSHIATDTNAAHLMEIWNLPESLKLQAQTVGKLSRAPWLILHRQIDTNAAALLRPVIEDIVNQESVLELREATNHEAEWMLAVKISPQQSSIWKTNLATVLRVLTGIEPDHLDTGLGGWSLQKHHTPDLIEFHRIGDWTVLMAGSQHDLLFGEWVRVAWRQGISDPSSKKGSWLEAEVVMPWLVARFAPDCRFLEGLKNMTVSVGGDGQNVLSRAQIEIAKDWEPNLEPWIIPTNQLEGPLTSCTMVRGLKSCLMRTKAWNDLQVGEAPDQIIFWAREGVPMQTYFAAPSPDTTNQVSKIADRIVRGSKAWFASNDIAMFGKSKKSGGLEWQGIPLVSPFLESRRMDGMACIYGGAFSVATPGLRATVKLSAVLSQPNLIYYDWEDTGLRIDQWIYMAQFIRVALKRSQLPSNSTGLLWLQQITKDLGISTTRVEDQRDGRLNFKRSSRIGFTALELQLLVDWLESPEFPIGSHTQLAPLPGVTK